VSVSVSQSVSQYSYEIYQFRQNGRSTNVQLTNFGGKAFWKLIFVLRYE